MTMNMINISQPMINIRQARPEDEVALLHIALRTGDAGQDASHLHTDPNLIGMIYSAPYLHFAPDLAFVAEQNGQVVGYTVGAIDSVTFQATLEERWWPPLRAQYQRPNLSNRHKWNADERRIHKIFKPDIIPTAVTGRYPAHMHMNLLPQARGQGVGTRLYQTLIKQAIHLDACAIHIGANRTNRNGVAFWRKCGFDEIILPDDDHSVSSTIWMGHILNTNRP